MQTSLALIVAVYFAIALIKGGIVFHSYFQGLASMHREHLAQTGTLTTGYKVFTSIALVLLTFGICLFWPYFLFREGWSFFLPYNEEAVDRESTEAVRAAHSDD